MKIYRAFRTWLNKYGAELSYLFLTIGFLLFVWLPGNPAEAVLISSFFFALMPFVLAVLLWKMWWNTWLEYRSQENYWSTDYCLVEIRLPEDVTKTPFAAELVIRSLYDVGEVDTQFDIWLKGKSKPWYSLEIVSTEGVVRFYIWMRRKYKTLIESQLYAHYPNVQVVEVPDYTLKVPFDPAIIDLWGIEQKLQKPDPYPITTYIEMKMDKAEVEEEFKHDPLVSILEFFGTMKEGEHAWLQIILRAHTDCPWAEEDPDIRHALKLEDWVQYEVDKITARVTDEKGKVNAMALTEGEKLAIAAMQMKLNKQVFDVGIRALHIGHKDKLEPNKRSGFPTTFRAFEHGSEGRGLNGFKPIFVIGPFFYAWQDFMGMRKAALKRKLYEAYVQRQYFYAPHKHRHIALNVEELASIFHLPGKVARTPTLHRMTSRRGEAPANLPT